MRHRRGPLHAAPACVPDRDMFGFRDIEIIRAIVRHGGFRAASDGLGLAQLAISRRVRLLEDRMKIAIFERDGRGAGLTAERRRLCDEAELLVAQRDRILEERTQNIMAGVSASEWPRR